MPQRIKQPLFQTAELGPLTGLLDVRSLPHEVNYGSFRWRENVAITAQGKACRRPGFEKMLGEVAPYNNQDLHDQLSDLRQPITYLFEARATTGVNKILAGTQNRLYAINDSTGNWRLLSDQLGGEAVTACSDTVWSSAQIEDIIVFTNGRDKPVYWPYDGAAASDGQSVREILDLNTLNITKAQVVASWKGVMILGNLTADGVRVPHRLVWSNFRQGLSFIPNQNVSIAGSHDLGYGEDILAILPLQDSLLIYTTHGIWDAQVTGDDSVFSFRQRYSEPRTGSGCLAYKRTLVSTGSEHIYFGRDGIYVYDLYSPRPTRPDWIHRASSIIFDELEDSLCSLHVGGWNSSKREAWFSWSRSSDTNRCPYRTLVVNTEYQSCDIIKRGFTAFVNYNPTPGTTVRDFILNQCICAENDLVAAINDVTEGGFCVTPSGPDCPDPATSFYTNTAGVYEGIATEDFSQSVPDAASLCGFLGDATLEQLCSEESATIACNAAQRFVMASTDDLCLKQYGTIYAHEICTNPEVCASYALRGYDTIFRSGPVDFKAPQSIKLVNRFLINFAAEFQTVPSNIVVRIGAAKQPSDPNIEDGCPIIWQTLPAKALSCGSAKTEAEHASQGTRPYRAIEWATWQGGNYIYYEFKIAGTGGASCFSSVLMGISAKPVRY